jgi:DNA polymerase-3 subunit gamma/tau
VVLTDLAEFTHFVTRVKIVPSVADDLSVGESERKRGKSFAAALSMRVLSRTWQMLLKGITETQEASKPISAAEMVLVRIAYAADLPTPDEVIRSLDQNGNGGGSARATNGGGVTQPSSPPMASRPSVPYGAPRASAAPAMSPSSEPIARATENAALALNRFEDVIALAADKRDLQIKAALERDVRLVSFEDGQLEISLEPSAPKTLVTDLQRKLSAWTGRRWIVVVSREAGAPTMKVQNEAREAELKIGVRADPLVQAVLDKFPGAEIVAVRGREQDAPLPPAHPEPREDDDE